jgi:D-alanyl-D-alanine dipeptidase
VRALWWVVGSLVGVGCLLAVGRGTLADSAPPLVDVKSQQPGIRVALSYGTAENAFRKRLYAGNVALLRAPVARRLARVQDRLEKQGYGLKVWDAYRPRSVQAVMWRLRPDARSKYLANPRKVSKHSRGAAVDVTLVRRDGGDLELPTPHDEFSPRAHRGATRGVSVAARRHWRILDTAMRAEGFLANRYEWWHFTDPEWRRYPPADVPVPAR